MAKSLAQIATRIKDLAAIKAPKKTGNLSRKIKEFNRPSGMIKETKSPKGQTSIEFSLDYAPPGAEYGMWWNDPTVSKTVKKGKTKNVPDGINFARKALDAPEIERLIDEYMNTIADNVVNQLKKSINDLDK